MSGNVVEVVNGQNENEKVFKLGFDISSEEVSYINQVESMRSPVASKIFGFPWTEAVTVGTDFVSVSKQDWVEWDVLQEPLTGLIDEHFDMAKERAGESKIEENPIIEKPKLDLSDPIAQKVKDVLDSEVNPAVAGHGGHVSLVDVKEGKAFVQLEGGCQGCAMSMATLKEGIEVAITGAVPEIKEVVDVTDHAMGANPYM